MFTDHTLLFSESGVGVNDEPHAPLTVDGDVNKDTSARGGVIAMRVQESGTSLDFLETTVNMTLVIL